MLKKLITMVALTTLYTLSLTADTLDEVIDRDTLRCGVVLDFPPIGYRDTKKVGLTVNSSTTSDCTIRSTHTPAPFPAVNNNGLRLLVH